jgi:hypothetical protein
METDLLGNWHTAALPRDSPSCQSKGCDYLVAAFGRGRFSPHQESESGDESP